MGDGTFKESVVHFAMASLGTIKSIVHCNVTIEEDGI